MTMQDMSRPREILANGLAPRSVTLGARYTPQGEDALLTGVQAIARLLVEQHASDTRAGKQTANFISGYQGSPLAGVDRLLTSMPGVLNASNTTFTPGLNEELGATAVWGSQIDLPKGSATVDGVVGYWYGKGPGFDRAMDALRHMNMFGVNPRGGVVLFVGDDPASKSSTVPAVSERSIASLHIPVLFPRNSAEVVRMGLHAVHMSRLSGCAVALKMTTDVAEGASIVRSDDALIDAVIPTIEVDGAPWTYTQRGVSLAPGHIQGAEQDLFGPRTRAIHEYARANDLNPVTVDPPTAHTGIIASGTTYSAVMQAFADMGVTIDDLRRSGIRVLHLGLMHPLDDTTIREFAYGLNEILVAEEKTPFIEIHVRDILYGMPNAPTILGKKGREGEPLLPADGELTADRIARPLARALAAALPKAAPKPTRIPLPLLSTNRKPYFCSGCPHNRSTVLPEGSIGGGGIGCHTMVTLESRETSNVTGITQMGGEGAQWIGQAPFTDVPHIFQNVGDGTFFHSGQLALQACIAAGVNITYKILYNEVVAMTGAQDAEGALPIPQLTHKLRSEGVAKIIVCSEDPTVHRKRDLAPGTLLWHRDRLDEAQLLLRDTPGVTVLIYEQHCAADARRLRKRGSAPQKTMRVVINEAVCEGCGDCGVKSNCLSVQPVDTAFGRKTRIDQTSCNTDYTCLDGDCPSFITVEVDPDHVADTRITTAPTVPSPPVRQVTESNVFLAGIGGTGIVTVNQVLATAAFIEGLDVHTLDQTGLSQKAGPVTGHLRFTQHTGHSTTHSATDGSNRVSGASADCVLAFDLMTATTPVNLAYVDPDRSHTIASTSETPTGDMVYNKDISYPPLTELLARIEPVSRSLITFDALAASEYLFGTREVANLLLVGAACQTGALALSPGALEEAITLNGVAVEANIQAFRWGRVAAHDPQTFRQATTPQVSRSDATDPRIEAFDIEGLPESVRGTLRIRLPMLIDFQNEIVARDYLAVVREAARADAELGNTVATYLYKLTAYKDEYEVARLLTQTDDTRRAVGDVPGAKDVTFRLHPPILRALGRTKKIAFGKGTSWSLGVLAKLKGLRGTPLDIFGYAHVRVVERVLRDHYRELVLSLAQDVMADPAGRERAIRIAALPDIVRGYEGIKLANVERYCDALEVEGVDAAVIRSVVR